MSYESVVLADSPTLFWRFQETSGTTVEDYTANNRDGSILGTGGNINAKSLFPADSSDKSYFFDGGGGDYRVSRAHGADVDCASGDFSFEIVFECDLVSTSDCIVSKGADNISDRGNFVLFTNSTNDLLFGFTTSGGSGRTQTITSALAAGPHHLVCVYDFTNAQMRSYLDGVELITTPAMTSNALSDAADLVLGLTSNLANNFDGYISEFALWNSVALTAGQAEAHYSAYADQSVQTTVATESDAGIASVAEIGVLTGVAAESDDAIAQPQPDGGSGPIDAKRIQMMI